MIYLLLVILLIIFIICYYVFDRDILQPSIIFVAFFVMSTLCTIYNVKQWGVNLHSNTLMVLLLGIISFVLFSFFIHIIYKKKRIDDYKNFYKEIDINKFVVLFLIVLSLIGLFLNYYYVRKIAQSHIYINDYSNMMAAFRDNVAYGEESMPFLVNQLNKVILVLGYIFTYIFINNIIISHKKNRNLIYVVIPIIYVISTLITAERAASLHLIVYAIGLIYILLKKYNVNLNINRVFVRKVFVVFVFVLFAFFSIRELVGRKANNDFIDYITIYTGGSIQLLDLYMENPKESTHFGEELFASLRSDLSKIDSSIISNKNKNLEFRFTHTGVSIGNVYTCFRKYYHDFGLFGVFLFSSLYGVIFTLIYEKIKVNAIKKPIDFRILFYCYLLYALCISSIQETFFSGYFAFKTVIYIILFKLFISLLCNGKKNFAIKLMKNE